MVANLWCGRERETTSDVDVGTVERLNCEETEECFPLQGFHDLDGHLEFCISSVLQSVSRKSNGELGLCNADGFDLVSEIRPNMGLRCKTRTSCLRPPLDYEHRTVRKLSAIRMRLK